MQDNLSKQLAPETYQKLRQLARFALQKNARQETMNTTAVVHEAFIKFYKKSRSEWQDQTHFYRAMAQIMRQIVIDYTRYKNAQIRKGEIPDLPLDAAGNSEEFMQHTHLPSIEFATALEKLAELDTELEHIFVLRYVAGFTITEIANALDITTFKVDKASRTARSFLGLHISGEA